MSGRLKASAVISRCLPEFTIQIANYAENAEKLFQIDFQNGPAVATLGHGAPIGVKTASLTVGQRGPILLQDVNYVDEMAHFDRERIPERVVHAKGAGAFGYFEVTHDISKYTSAKIFEKIGKRTVSVP